MKSKLLTTGFLIIALVPALIFARPGQGKGQSNGNQERMGKKQDHIEILKKEIGISDAQVKQIEKLRLKNRGKIEDLTYEIKKAKRSFLEKSLDGKISKSEVKKVLSKIGKLRMEIGEVREETVSSIVDVLTEDQIKIMAEKKMLGKMLHFKNDKMGKHHKKGGKHGNFQRGR